MPFLCTPIGMIFWIRFCGNDFLKKLVFLKFLSLVYMSFLCNRIETIVRIALCEIDIL